MARKTTIPSTDLNERISEVINRVAFGNECFVVTRYRKPLVILLPYKDGNEHENERKHSAPKVVRVSR